MTITAFAFPDELSAWTNGKISPADPRSQDLLNGASAAIRRYCGWHICGVETDTRLFDGPGGNLLQLPTLHLVDVSSVTVNGQPVADYEWSETGELRCTGSWGDRYRSVNVTFQHGYEGAPDVKQIVLQVCAAALSSPMGATREQAGQVSISWATTAPGVAGGLSLLDRDFQVLNAYKLPGRL